MPARSRPTGLIVPGESGATIPAVPLSSAFVTVWADSCSWGMWVRRRLSTEDGTFSNKEPYWVAASSYLSKWLHPGLAGGGWCCYRI